MDKTVIRPLLVSAVGHLALRTGLARKSLVSAATEDRFICLYLHRVSPEVDPTWQPTHPAVFRDVVRWLSANADVTPLESERTSGLPRVVLTFDDAYADFIEYAVPILEEYKLPACQMVVTACLQSGRPPWTTEVVDFFRSRSDGDISRLSRRDPALPTTKTATEVQRFIALLKEHPSRSREARFGWFLELVRDGDFPRTRMASAEQLRSLSGLFSLGLHSHSHEDMSKESDAFFERDLEMGIDAYQALFGSRPFVYSFPNGGSRPSLVETLRSRQFRFILETGERPAKRGSDVIQRIQIGEDAYPASVARASYLLGRLRRLFE
jgi:peptidoglycan/xylan/chitin deacetylase (PgdA/CDA1 family)